MATNDRHFAEREKRFNDVVALRKPDRVPVIPLIIESTQGIPDEAQPENVMVLHAPS